YLAAYVVASDAGRAPTAGGSRAHPPPASPPDAVRSRHPSPPAPPPARSAAAPRLRPPPGAAAEPQRQGRPAGAAGARPATRRGPAGRTRERPRGATGRDLARRAQGGPGGRGGQLLRPWRTFPAARRGPRTARRSAGEAATTGQAVRAPHHPLAGPPPRGNFDGRRPAAGPRRTAPRRPPTAQPPHQDLGPHNASPYHPSHYNKRRKQRCSMTTVITKSCAITRT